MKSKVLSLVLALTLLCSIMVPTAAFAEVDKGNQITIVPDTMFKNGIDNIAIAGILNRECDGRTEDFPLIQITKGKTITASGGTYPQFDVPHNLDLAMPFTFQFDFYAREVWAAFSVGDKDVFVCDQSGNAYLNSSKKDITLATEKWHTVHFTYDGQKYAVYADDVLLGEFTEFSPNANNMRIGTFLYTAPVNKNGLLVVDEVYAYQSAYEPEVSEDPVEPSEPEEDEEVTEATYIPVTTNNFKYNAGAQYGTSAEMRTMKDKADVNNSVPVIKFPKGQKVTVSGGKYPRFEITHGLTTTKSFTFMFDYFAHDIWTGFSLGTDDIFAVKNANGANTPVYYHDGSFKEVVGTTISADEWHTVVFSYSKTTGMYSLYVDGTCIKTFNRTITDPDPTTIRIGTFLNSEPVEDDGGYIAVDNVYVYQDEYNPDIVLNEPEDVITITANAKAATVAASVTLSDKYATGDYCLWLATYDTTDDNNQLIGITCAEITEAGYQDLVITFEDSNAFSNVDYAQAFIWDKDYKPTGVYELLGTKPQ